MLKINFIILAAMLAVLSACSKPGSSPNSLKKVISGAISDVDSSPLTVGISDDATTSPSATLEVAARKRAWNVRPILIRNNSLADKSVVIVNSLDSNVEVEEDCPEEPAQLAARQYCTFYIYFNRQLDKPAEFSQSVGSVSINGVSIAVTAVIVGPTDIAEATADIHLSKTAVDFGSLNDEEEKRDAITILNKSATRLPLHYDDLSSIGSGFSGTTTCPPSGSLLISRKACIISITQDGSAAGAGTHDATVEVAGKIVTLDSVVTAAPIVNSNPSLTWLNPLASPSFSMENGMNESYVFNIENRTTESQSLFVNDFSFGALALWPDAFNAQNECNPVAGRKPCTLTLTFDPERFHFGVVFEKDAFIQDEEVAITLTGNSPCNPDHPTPRPDAAYGKKLNANKSACIDNVGVFDDPDSVYGHAVFQ